MTPRAAPEPADTGVLLPALAALPGHLLWRAHGRVLLLIAERLPPGVDLPAYAALLALADGRPRSQQSLAETTTVSRTTITRVAAALATDGLVERVRNPDDKRSWALTRTDAGASAVRRWERHAVDLELAVAAPLSTSKRHELRDLLRVVVGAEIPTDAPAELGASVAFLVSRAHQLVHRDFHAALEPLALEPRHFGALVALTSTGPVSQIELARHLGISPASIVQVADDLERWGHAHRRRPATDRRTQLLHVADHVPALLTRAHQVNDRAVGRHLDALDADRRARLVELLRLLVTGG